MTLCTKALSAPNIYKYDWLDRAVQRCADNNGHRFGGGNERGFLTVRDMIEINIFISNSFPCPG